MRVYLDTNIYSETFRDSSVVSRFKSAKKHGLCHFSGSVEVIQEIVSHRGNLSEAKLNFRRFADLVSPRRISIEPALLVMNEIEEKIADTERDVYMSAAEARNFLKTVYDNFESPEIEKLCRDFSEAKKTKFKERRDDYRHERETVQFDPGSPFPPIYANLLTDGALQTLQSPYRSFDLEAPISKIERALTRLDQLPATRSSLAIVAAQMYRQLLSQNNAQPHRNDDMDIRIGITAAYSDVIVTADSSFRATLITCKSLLPFRALSPEDFLAELNEASASPIRQ